MSAFVRVAHYDGHATYQCEEAHVTRTAEGGTVRLVGCRRVARYVGPRGLARVAEEAVLTAGAGRAGIDALYRTETFSHHSRTIRIPDDASAAFVMDERWKTREIVRARRAG